MGQTGRQTSGRIAALPVYTYCDYETHRAQTDGRAKLRITVDGRVVNYVRGACITSTVSHGARTVVRVVNRPNR